MRGKWMLIVSVFAALTVNAEVRMPKIFGDHMVLQQDEKISVWGWADAGERVTVSFAGRMATAVAADDGAWKVELPPVKSSADGQTLTVKGRNTLTFSDVLAGDVWVASGQSNMEFGITNRYYRADVEQSEDAQLRLFFVPKNTALEPLTDIEIPKSTENPDWAARWILCTPEALRKINGQGFASTAYYFAKNIRAANGRPLGVIQSCWGGTRAEAWTSLAGLESEPRLENYVKRQKQNVADNPAIVADYEQKLADFKIALKEWDETTGKAWNQAQREWEAACKQAAADGQPAPPKPQPATRRPSNPREPNGGNNGPANLFNAMIAPLMPLTIKGVIWYQGEFNSGGSGKEYATLFPLMVSDWRKHWGIGDFAFIYVQLPNFGPVDKLPSAEGEGWRWVREAQLKTLALPNTGMAVTIDVGDPFDLHPPDKWDVGARLALAARQVAYGEKIAGTSPLFDSLTISGNKALVKFKNTAGGLEIGVSPYIPEKGDPPQKLTTVSGFAIAGDDQKFYPAVAEIHGDTVTVSAAEVQHPVAVRYGFANSPECNLYNKANLPAAPFRTDEWEK